MRRDDKISFILSAILNIIIILCIPKIHATIVQDRKIKVGLINVCNNSKTIVEENSKKQEKTKKIDAEKLRKLKPKFTKPKINVLASKGKGLRKVADTDFEKSYNEKGIIKNVAIINEIDLDTKIIPKKQEKIENDFEKIDVSTLGHESLDISEIEIAGEKRIGLPSGYKLGTEDGDIIAKWDPKNIEPTYPESAQVRGLHGKVKIRMTIDEYGNIVSLFIEQGSGVPEINNAIERVGHSWKIYLSKNGMNVKGDVILEYNFILK